MKRLLKLTLIALGMFAALVVVVSMVGRSTPPRPLTGADRDAVRIGLAAKALTQPDSLELNDIGFVVVEYELPDTYVRQLAIPLQAFAEMRLLAIREELLPYGYDDYRVNINGTPPGTGLVKRYGSARLIGSGSLEWLTP